MKRRRKGITPLKSIRGWIKVSVLAAVLTMQTALGGMVSHAVVYVYEDDGKGMPGFRLVKTVRRETAQEAAVQAEAQEVLARAEVQKAPVQDTEVQGMWRLGQTAGRTAGMR